MENQNTQNDVITLRDLFLMFKSHIVAFILICVATFALGIVFNAVQKPTYVSQTTIFVNFNSENQTGSSGNQMTSDYNYSKYISDTFVEFITEGIVIDSTVNDLRNQGINITASQLVNNLSISRNSSSLIITVKYEGLDGQTTKIVLDELVENVTIISNKEENGNPVYRMLHGCISQITPAKTGVEISHTLRNLAIFVVLGVVLGCAYVFIRELFNNHFKSSDEIERVLQVPVIAVIPQYELEEDGE